MRTGSVGDNSSTFCTFKTQNLIRSMKLAVLQIWGHSDQKQVRLGLSIPPAWVDRPGFSGWGRCAPKPDDKSLDGGRASPLGVVPAQGHLGSPRGDPVPIQATLSPQKGLPVASGMSDCQQVAHGPVQAPLCQPTGPAIYWPLLRQPLRPWRPLRVWRKMLPTVSRAGLRNPPDVSCVATGK